MSVWKKAAKANQKTHRERHQPRERKHLGLLEKKKDYKKRATDYGDKQAALKLLRKRALNKNPDEFYHHMINSKTENGLHFEKETEDEDTPEQLSLMRSQDLRYITTKKTSELKKIERLQAQLHLSSVDCNNKGKHTYFRENLDETYTRKSMHEKLAKFELPDVDLNALRKAAAEKKALYKQLIKRINRERELAIVQQKLELRRHLEGKKSILPPKRVRKGNKDSPAVYVWKYERKR